MNFKKEFQRGPNVCLVELGKLTLPVDADDVPRRDYGDLDQLARSLAIDGQEYPIKVRAEGDKIIVTDGARRTKAAELANEKGYGKKKITHLLAMIEEKGTDPVTRIGNKLAANLSKPFEPEELGDTYKNLRDKHGKTVAEIAEIGKVSTTKVRDYLRLIEAPESLKKQVREKKLRPSTAMKAILKGAKAVEDVTLQTELGHKVKGKDIEEEKPESQLPDTEVKPIENFENMVEGYRKSGWITKEEAAKENRMGMKNLMVIIKRFTPPADITLVK